MKRSNRLTVMLIILAVLVLSLAALLVFTILSMQALGSANIETYRHEEIESVKQTLKNYVDIGYTTVETNYRSSLERGYLVRHYGQRLMDVMDIAEATVQQYAAAEQRGEMSRREAQKQAQDAINLLRYGASGADYFWIQDTGTPFPKMIMHPISPELDGQVLDNEKFNVALGRGDNLFVAMAAEATQYGDGFVDYIWPKPTKGGLVPDVPKLSYVRLIEEWDWVIGTGIYIDDSVLEGIEQSKGELRSMRYDNGVGYFWINDMQAPIPHMVMHPILPELEGEIMDDPKYNATLEDQENIFIAFVEATEANGSGYVTYLWPKPTASGISEDVPKLSYVRRFEALSWIIGTGVYIDDIDLAVARQQEAGSLQVRQVTLQVAAVSVLILLGGIVVINALMKRFFRVQNGQEARLPAETDRPAAALKTDEDLAALQTILDAAGRRSRQDPAALAAAEEARSLSGEALQAVEQLRAEIKDLQERLSNKD